MRKFIALSLAVLVSAGLSSRSALSADDLVAAAIENVSVLDRPGQVGYVTVWDGNKFVQCRRVPTGAVRCEAAGSLMQPILRAVLTPERRENLMAQGWSHDKAFGHYVQLFPPDLSAAEIAEKVRMALIEGYGANPAQIETRTRWIDDVPCPPRITATQALAGLVDEASDMGKVTRRLCSFTPGKPEALPVGQQSADANLRRSVDR